MNKIIVLAFLVFLLPFNIKADPLKPYKMPRTHVVAIHDSKADRPYELYIKLPENYSENTDEKYPVIFTTDGKWHMDMLSGATEYLMPNVILVGISWQLGLDDEREFISRLRDYTIAEIEDIEIQAKYQFGQAADHLSFVRDDVIPYVEENYRTDPGNRAYFGYSLGGVFGAYILSTRPETFQHYIFGSPAVDERDLSVLREVNAKGARPKVNAFLSIGELEDDQMASTKSLLSLLKEQGGENLSLTDIEIIEGSDHGTAFPDTVVHGIKWLSRLIVK